jgi:transketolase
MRVEFAQTIIELASTRDDLLFLTGDLGYMALEDVRRALGSRFINAGVAEQNMVSMAAGLAARGFFPIVYSIAPFATFRPFEQIRNDVCLHDLPVVIVGNGGGYGYGIMGGTHHALEDVAVMRSLPNMRVFVPSFGSDVKKCVNSALEIRHPAYLRLGKSVKDHGQITPEAPWAGFRRVCEGDKIAIAVMGPVVENVLSVIDRLPPGTVDLWSVGEFPVACIPQQFHDALIKTRKLITIEEHYKSGGLAESIAPYLVGIPQMRLESLAALGYPSGLYGSQKWHQDENNLGIAGVEKAILGQLGS